jgi:hypothetical protein
MMEKMSVGRWFVWRSSMRSTVQENGPFAGSKSRNINNQPLQNSLTSDGHAFVHEFLLGETQPPLSTSNHKYKTIARLILNKNKIMRKTRLD